MPEEKKVVLMGRRAGELLAGLSDIVDDLWGGVSATASPAPQTPVPQAAAPQPAAPQAFPPFEQLWKVADETVDWTDALVRETPADGLSDPAEWALYHRHAARVLAGDTDAYLAVIEAMQPLGDLSAYAASFDVAAPSSDELHAAMQALPCYLDKPEAEARRYLAGMAVRIARDLFALLPVTRVRTDIRRGDKTLLTVTFEKAGMMTARFAFIDPVAFALQCGGIFGE